MTEHRWVELFSKNLKNLMQERGVSAAVVSKATGIPKSTLSEWQGGRKPTLDESIVRLARFFGVSVEFLITGQHPEETLIKDVVSDFEEGFVTIHRGVYRINVEKYMSGKSGTKKAGGKRES